jgi:urocanate hydratase
LPPDTVLSVVSALETERLTDRTSDGRYSLGLGLVNLAGRVGGLEPLRSCALPLLTELRDATGETAVLLVPDGDHSMCIELVESHQPLRHTGWVGKRVPLAGTATGAALAGVPGAQVADGVVEPGVTAISCLVEGSSSPPAVVSISGPTFRVCGESLAHTRAAVEAAAHGLAQHLRSLSTNDR